MNEPPRTDGWLCIGICIVFILLVFDVHADECHQAHEQCGHEDGTDGRDGTDGVDGKDGQDGIDGKDGIDGIVPTKWITETRNEFLNVNKWYRSAREAAAASAAMQVHLPQDRTSRLTFGMSHLNNTTGVGVGYAYMLDNERNSALTIAVGMAGDETAIKGSYGFEFGSNRHMEATPITLDIEQTYEDKFAQYDDLIQAQQEEIEYQREELAASVNDRDEVNARMAAYEARAMKAESDARNARSAAQSKPTVSLYGMTAEQRQELAEVFKQ